MTTLLPALSGANTLYGSGMLELGMTFSLEQLLFDNDMISMTKKAMEGIEVTDETMNIDNIRKVGIGNNFLALKDTRQKIDLPSDPMFIDRRMFGDWEKDGSKDIIDVAHEKVEDILKNYEVEPIDSDIQKDMKAVMDRADKEVMGQ
jgi:trimethylamine--corrinoid protein Co-methyltransferase